MTQADDINLRLEALQERLSRLSEASLSINDSLDLDAVLPNVLDSARSLIGAQYGVMTMLDESGRVEDFLASGLAPQDAQQVWDTPGGPDILRHLDTIAGPLRVSDFTVYAADMGLPEFNPPTPMGPFLSVPVLHRGDRLGSIHMAKGAGGQEFSREDEETLVMFASQAALVIANARRHRDEQQARLSLEALIDTSPVGVVVFDARTGGPISFNREGVRIIDGLRDPEQPPEDLLGLMTIRRADGREFSLMEFPLAQVLSVSETVRAEEIVMEAPDGRSITVLLNATPIRSEEGGVESVVVTMQDMTPLQEVERLRAEFLGMVSHELRLPLTSIRGSATTMLEASSDLDPAELSQFLRIIVDQSDNMRELIDNLLDMARIETGELPVNPEPVEVVRLVDRARNTFLSAGGRNNLAIDLASDLPLMMADRRRIVQVIGNLLTNAARHSPESSVIRVSAERDGVHVRVSVVDEGRGIPTERLPNLFWKFSHQDDDDPGGDTGLGLAICKGIVEAHGGRIWADSDGSGLGARFTFTIPSVEDPAVEYAQIVAPSRQRRRGSMPILVVDDDPHTLRQVRNILSRADYDPIVTAEPDDVLELVAEHRPRLALLDVMLPGYNGIDLMKDIFSIAEVPVVFLSAYGQQETIANAFESGASDYIVKPFTPTELVARVRAVLVREEGRYQPQLPEPYVLGDLKIDYETRLVTISGRPLEVTAKEYDLLRALSLNTGRVMTHDQLLRRVWGAGRRGNVPALRAHLRRLRIKLGEDGSSPTYIFSEPGVGYRMPMSETQEEP